MFEHKLHEAKFIQFVLHRIDLVIHLPSCSLLSWDRSVSLQVYTEQILHGEIKCDDVVFHFPSLVFVPIGKCLDQLL